MFAHRNKIAAELETRARGVGAEALPDFIAEAEQYLFITLRTELLSFMRRTHRARVSLDESKFQVGHTIYLFELGESIVAPAPTLHVTIRPAIDLEGQSRSTVRLPIDVSGSFSEVSVTVPDTFVAYLVPLAQLAQSVYAAGYGWLNEFTKSALDQLVSILAVEVYGYARRAFGTIQQPTLAQEVYFAHCSPGRGVTYLTDPTTTEHIVGTIGKRNPIVGSSAALATELLTTAIPYEKAFNREAILHGDTLEADLSSAKYFEELPLYDIAERTLFGTSDAFFLPIAQVGDRWLSAFFPATMHAQVVPVLKNPLHRLRLREIFATHETRLKHWKSVLRKAGPSLLSRGLATLAADYTKKLLE